IVRIHRAERMTHRALRLVRELMTSGHAILVVLCTHDEATGMDVDSLENLQRMRLAPLANDAARGFVRALFGGETDGNDRASDAHDVIDQVVAQVEPLPGLVIDALEVARTRNQVEGRPGHYRSLVANVQLPIEGRLENYLEAMFDGEDEHARKLLEAAAILGPRFRVDDLASLLGEEQLTVLANLSALRDRWFLGADGALRFRRRSQRRFVLERCEPDERARLQRLAAERFEARGARPLKRAIHWARAGDAQRAVPLLLDGAERAIRRRELAAAELLLVRVAQQLDHALRIPALVHARLRACVLEADLELVRGRPVRAEERIRRGLTIAHVARDEVLVQRLEILAARAARARGFRRDAMRRLEAVLPQLEGTGDEIIDARIDHVSLLEENGGLRAAWREAREIERTLSTRDDADPGVLARCDLVLGTLEAKRLHVERAEELFEQAENRLRKRGESRRLVELHLRRAELALDLGDEREFRRELARADALFERDASLVSLLAWRARRHYLEALFEIFVSRPAEALPHLERAARDAESFGDSFGGVAVQVAVFEAMIALQTATEEQASAVLRQTARAGDPRLFMLGCTLAAEFHRRKNDLPRAISKLDAAFDELGKHSVEPTFPLRMLLTKSRILRDQGDSEAARRTRRLAKRRLERLSLRLRRADRHAFLRANPVRRAILASR
ncbi:MAG: hypothetical protein KDC95_15840, partial [Planctomycetes bacterium]|nr:hypothetical protein [Planctomycetota bacterium]